MKLDPQAYLSFPLGDGNVILRHGLTKLFALNTTGHQLWQALLTNQQPKQIAEQWSNYYGIHQDQALTDIQAALDSWQQQGLLGDFPTVVEQEPIVSAQPIQFRTPPCPYQQDYRLGCFNIRLQTNSREIIELLQITLAPFSTASIPAPQTLFDIVCTDDCYWLCLSGKVLWHGKEIDTIINGLFYELLQVGVREIDWLVALHAGAVSKNDTVIAFSGIGGTGKSTLTAALLSRDFCYWGDDIILIEKDTLLTVPLPAPITVKKGSWNLLAHYFPHLDSLPIYQRLGKQVRYLPPPSSVASNKKPLTHLVFPRVSTEDAMQLRPLTPLDTLQRLLAANSSLAHPITEDRVTQLIDWLNTLSSFELVFSNLEHGMDIIERELL